ncbi:hypothetical protein [Nostoc sp. FACHB-280]|uniref:hypothetical protein n=1 Tax=Nostoc sp. FACHB-280 TaxID=2692839 RepID=UPI00168B18BE|nr:hypothetical protein [Nostoc sp. FACHB-280]MBD2494502.1 hypothetical protein [Nostoc sp. FACHB-280]
MEPITLILTALAAGATAAAKDTAGTAVKDAYEGLKTLIKNQFAGDPFAQGMVDAKPEEIQEIERFLKDKIIKAGVDKNDDVLKKAEEIREIMKKENPEGGSTGKYEVNVQGSRQFQVGDNNVQHNA